jgi:hypothetical protein
VVGRFNRTVENMLLDSASGRSIRWRRCPVRAECPLRGGPPNRRTAARLPQRAHDCIRGPPAEWMAHFAFGPSSFSGPYPHRTNMVQIREAAPGLAAAACVIPGEGKCQWPIREM